MSSIQILSPDGEPRPKAPEPRRTKAKVHKWFATHWAKILPIIVSLAALTISYLGYSNSSESLNTSKDSLTTAKESLTASKRALIETQRPFLNVKLVKHPGTDDLLKIAPSANPGSLEVTLRFELTNNGRSPAQEISLPSKFILAGGPGVSIPQSTPPNFTTPGLVALGPSASQNLDVTIGLRADDLGQLTQELEQDCYLMEVDLTWCYKGEADSSASYTTNVRYRVQRSRSELLHSHMS